MSVPAVWVEAIPIISRWWRKRGVPAGQISARHEAGGGKSARSTPYQVVTSLEATRVRTGHLCREVTRAELKIN